MTACVGSETLLAIIVLRGVHQVYTVHTQRSIAMTMLIIEMKRVQFPQEDARDGGIGWPGDGYVSQCRSVALRPRPPAVVVRRERQTYVVCRLGYIYTTN